MKLNRLQRSYSFTELARIQNLGRVPPLTDVDLQQSDETSDKNATCIVCTTLRPWCEFCC